MNAAAGVHGTLFVIGTPIGNLGDMSPRAREVLGAADLIAAEDTRRTRGLLSHIGVETRVIAYHEHNERERVPELLERLARGAAIALVSDAGTPLVSDPGWRLVRAARAAGHTVTSVPGPSALTAALSTAGLPTDRFVFEGFLPRRDGPRAVRLAELKREPRTIVLFEAVHRLPATFAALVRELGAEREAVVARELTKVHEQIEHGTLGDLAARLGADVPLLGEFVIVVAGAPPSSATVDDDEARRIFGLLSAAHDPGTALKLTAAITGLSRNTLYRLTRT